MLIGSIHLAPDKEVIQVPFIERSFKLEQAMLTRANAAT